MADFQGKPKSNRTRDSQFNFRLSDEGRSLLVALQEHYGGLSQADLVELLLRQTARREGVTPRPFEHR